MILVFSTVIWWYARVAKVLHSTTAILDSLTLCMLGNFACFFVCGFFYIYFFKKNLSGIPSEFETVWIQIRPGFCQAWSGSKLFAKVIRRWKKSPLVGKELITGWNTFPNKFFNSLPYFCVSRLKGLWQNDTIFTLNIGIDKAMYRPRSDTTA